MPEGAVASPTPEASSATPATGPESAATGTASTVGGDANRQGAPAEEQFDVNTLPAELRSKYDNMLRDYKSKTEKLANERRSYEDRLKKAEILEALEQHPKYPELVKFWNGLTQEQQKAAADAGGSPNGQGQAARPTSEDWAAAQGDSLQMQQLVQREIMAEKAELQQQQAEIKQEILVRDAKEVINAFADMEDEKGTKIRPDFDELHENGLISMFLDRMNPQDKRQMNTAIAKAYEQAKSVADHFHAKGKNEGLGIIQQKAAQSTQQPTVTAGETYGGKDPKSLSVSEARALAKKGIKVPQSW